MTFDDYVRAQRNHARKRNVTIVLLLAAFAVFVAVATWNYIFPVFVLTYLAVREFLMRARSKRLWQQTPALHQGQKTFGLDTSGFHGEDDEGHPTVVHWDKFLKYRESKDTFFLYLSPHMFLYLPKRLIAIEDQARIGQLLKENIGQPRRSHSVRNGE